jgi:hypothetical protein
MHRMSDPVDESFLDQYLDTASSQAPSLDKSRPVRQGLPSGYRMRHDAHYVDELESRRAGTAHATVQAGHPNAAAASGAPALAFPTSIPVTFALRDMSQELEGVASCFNLVAAKARPLRERMGLSLARVGVERNMRSFQALRVLLEDPPPEPATTSLTSIIGHTVDSFDEELRVTGLRISLDLPDTVIRVTADARMLSLALQACVGTLVSLVEASNAPDVIHVAARLSDGIASCEMRQDAYRLSADQFARLTDLEWSERPGGIPAGIGLAAAARIAQAHGGGLDARRTDSGGCLLMLTIRA